MTSILEVEGGHPLTGSITVRGAKNFVPKAMVAALLATTPSELYNVPLIRDVDVVSNLMRLHGAHVDFDQDRGVMRIDPSNVEVAQRSDIDALGGSSRIPILFCGPLLHRMGEAFIPQLGGCNIGGRPIDFHLQILRQFGAIVDKRSDGIHMSRPAEGLRGTVVDLPFPSVGATEQTLLTAVRAEGVTILRGAAVEPEIMDLINVLQKMGAIISPDTDRSIRIEGSRNWLDIGTPRCPTASKQHRGARQHWQPAAMCTSRVRANPTCSHSSTPSGRSAAPSTSRRRVSASIILVVLCIRSRWKRLSIPGS